MTDPTFDELYINVMPLLDIDALQIDDSGHLSILMGTYPMACVLSDMFLECDSLEPKWPEPDQFILSPSRASDTLYSLEAGTARGWERYAGLAEELSRLAAVKTA